MNSLYIDLFVTLTQLKHSTETTVKMTDQVDHSRQEKKEMQKALSKAEAKIRKLEKPPNKRASSVLQTHEIESETLYEQERDRNQVLHYMLYHVLLSMDLDFRNLRRR